MTFWDTMVYLTNRVDWMVLFGGILIFGTIVIFWTMSRDKSSKFSFADAYAGENGKTSMSKLGYWIATLVCSYGMVTMFINDTMTYEVFGLYIFALVLGKVGTETVGVFRQAQIARTAEARAGIVNEEPEQPSTMDLQMSVSAPAADTPVARRTPAPPKVSLSQAKQPLGKRRR